MRGTHKESAGVLLSLSGFKNQVEGMLYMQTPASHQRDSGVIGLGLGKGLYGFNKVPRRFRCRWSMKQAVRIPTYDLTGKIEKKINN